MRIRHGQISALALVAALAGCAPTSDRAEPAVSVTPSVTRDVAAEPDPAPAAPGSLAYGVDGDIYVADWDGSKTVRIADGRPPKDCGFSGEYWGEGSIWSPDGRYLAYRRRSCEAPRIPWWRVVISDPEGHVVAEFPGGGWDISWSPDSNRVAVWVDVFETIGIYGLDGVRQALLTVPPGMMPSGDIDPVWSPDGESLQLSNDLVLPIDGSTPYNLPWGDPRNASVTLSPDGSRVAYVIRKSLVVAEADDSNPHQVFDDWVWDLVWSPTGDRIAFTSQGVRGPWGGRPNQLRVLDVATGRATMLAEMDRSEALEAIEFSPEGERILFSRAEYSGAPVGSLWSINADGSNPRRLVTGTTWGDWHSLSQAR